MPLIFWVEQCWSLTGLDAVDILLPFGFFSGTGLTPSLGILPSALAISYMALVGSQTPSSTAQVFLSPWMTTTVVPHLTPQLSVSGLIVNSRWFAWYHPVLGSLAHSWPSGWQLHRDKGPSVGQYSSSWATRHSTKSFQCCHHGWPLGEGEKGSFLDIVGVLFYGLHCCQDAGSTHKGHADIFLVYYQRGDEAWWSRVAGIWLQLQKSGHHWSVIALEHLLAWSADVYYSGPAYWRRCCLLIMQGNWPFCAAVCTWIHAAASDSSIESHKYTTYKCGASSTASPAYLRLV